MISSKQRQKNLGKKHVILSIVCRHDGLIVIGLASRSSGPVSNPGWGHCVVFLGKAFYSHSASLKLDVKVVTGKLNKKNTL